MTYETKAVQEQEQKKAAELEARNREVFDEVQARFPLRAHEANFKLLVDWSGDGVLTLEKAEYLLKRKPEGFHVDVTTREALIEELGAFLRETTSEKTLSAHDFRMWKFRASTWSLRQIRAYKRELELKRQLQTVEQARNYLTQARGMEGIKYPGWPVMLKTVVPRGEIFAREFNAAYIKSLDAFELKRLIAVYGLEQVNDRIAGRS